ncbi:MULTISPECIES: rhodanese-like domain-containing protein [Calothrix]|uniref:Rhodanese-like domain-containing protein n=2 Tax=Calothrix TaxID=1186 RepID=A0ABR8AEJ6_9CYAN|nr:MULTISPECIES: rhodanese-like domain-containing protein [Calothrix]MBD2198455.1 rhodanese-like domain-containing protein [Calothrix parietina FACHB-288]MBD2226857.1 rhodanese-like domain-containing protein [Calothrix anomala FACHB-343]
MTTSGVNKLQTVSAQTLKQLVEQKAVTLIDVREPAEYAGEHIPGATLVSLSNFDPRKIPQDGSIVLYCRSGNRSAMAAQKLFSAGFATVTHLNGGIGAWKEAGYPTNINRKTPISLLRQVQIITGSSVLIGTLLGVVISPWFLILSGVMGVGLIYSGITDTCILGMMLAKLPYNKRSIV